MFPLLAAPLARRGIQLTYAATPGRGARRRPGSAYYDALMLYGNHTDDHARAGEGARRLRRGRARADRAPFAPPRSSPGRTDTSRWSAAQFQRHGTGEFTAEIVAADASGDAGRQAVPRPGTKPTSTRKHNPVDRTVLMERVDAAGPRAVDVGADAGQGPRVLHGLRARRAHVEQARVPDARRATRVAVGRRRAARAARGRRSRCRRSTYLDGFNVPNYENRDPAPKYQMPFTAEDCAEVHADAGRVRGPALRAASPTSSSRSRCRFDERGRLWVVEAMDYPNEVLDGEPGDDRIKILEDTNGDGKRRQVHGLRRSAQPADQPRPSPTAASSSRRRRTCCSSRTPTATTRPTCGRS